MNYAEIHALLGGMSNLENFHVIGKISVLGISHLTINLCIQRACPSKPELFCATNKIVAIQKWLDGAVMFCRVGREENQLVDWLTNMVRFIQHDINIVTFVPPSLTKLSSPSWPASKA